MVMAAAFHPSEPRAVQEVLRLCGMCPVPTLTRGVPAFSRVFLDMKEHSREYLYALWVHKQRS